MISNGMQTRAGRHLYDDTCALDVSPKCGKAIHHLNMKRTQHIRREKKNGSEPLSHSTNPQRYLLRSQSAKTDIGLFHAGDRKLETMSCGKPQLGQSVSPSVGMHQIAEIRAKHMREKKLKPIRTDDDSSDTEDDSWLDDEQWYCEHLAQWSGRVKVTAAVQQNPAKLKDFLETHFSH